VGRRSGAARIGAPGANLVPQTLRRIDEKQLPDCAGSSSACKARIAGLCNPLRNTAGGRKDEQAGNFFDRNRLNPYAHATAHSADVRSGRCNRSTGSRLGPALSRLSRCYNAGACEICTRHERHGVDACVQARLRHLRRRRSLMPCPQLDDSLRLYAANIICHGTSIGLDRVPEYPSPSFSTGFPASAGRPASPSLGPRGKCSPSPSSFFFPS
jgi:hypothetical protein